MDVLERLFGSAAKVRIMRLFVSNPGLRFGGGEIAERTKTSPEAVRREVHNLAVVGLVERRLRGRSREFQLDPAFPLLIPLRSILKSNLASNKKELIRRFGRSGKLTLLVIAGVFLENNDARADLLVVGNHLRKNAVEKAVKGLEAELSRELSYAVLDTADFTYRLTACDKFVRDILDYPHQILLDKIGLK